MSHREIDGKGGSSLTVSSEWGGGSKKRGSERKGEKSLHHSSCWGAGKAAKNPSSRGKELKRKGSPKG